MRTVCWNNKPPVVQSWNIVDTYMVRKVKTVCAYHLRRSTIQNHRASEVECYADFTVSLFFVVIKLVEKYKIPPILKYELYFVFWKLTIAREVSPPSPLQSADLTANDFYSLTRGSGFWVARACLTMKKMDEDWFSGLEADLYGADV
jgi:hypothetical protein